MKRILWLLSFAPLLGFGQGINQDVDQQFGEKDLVPHQKAVNSGSSMEKDYQTLTSRKVERKPASQLLKKSQTSLDFTLIGVSYYDLQSNDAVGRKIFVHDDGTISAVWTHSSSSSDPSFAERGTGFNYFDGNEWLKGPDTIENLEDRRVGWPNINVDKSGNNKEVFMIGHLAPLNSTSGGHAFSKGEPAANNFTTKYRDVGQGPIWYRTAQGGGKFHMIGNYFTGDEDTVWKKGMWDPMVYYRSDDYGESWEVNQKLLPGYADSSRRRHGRADNYAIDARDSIVVIALASDLPVPDVTFWKSTDSGKTWDMHKVFEYPFNYEEEENQDPPFNQPFWTNDETLSIVLDKDGVAHLSYGVRLFTERDVQGNIQFSTIANGIHYWNDQHKDSMVLDRVDTNYKDSVAYSFRIDGKRPSDDTLYYNKDTAYKYSYNSNNNSADSTKIAGMNLKMFGNYNKPAMDPFVPTMDTTIWPVYKRYEYDNSGNKTDSTLVVSDTLYLDSTTIQVVDEIDSVFKNEKIYANDPIEAGYMPGNDNNPLSTGVINLDSIEDSKVVYPEPSDTRLNPYGNAPISSQPSLVHGGEDTLFLLYQSYDYGAVLTSNQPNYRDIFVTYSTDNGQTWSKPLNVSQTAQGFSESAFPSANPKVVNGKIHFTWMEDRLQGVAFGQGSFQNEVSRNSIYYGALDIDSVIQRNHNSSVNVNPAETYHVSVNTYPNPFSNEINVNLKAERQSDAQVKLYDIMGKVKTSKDLGLVSKGENHFKLNTANLSKGVYFLKVSIGDKIKSRRIIKQ